MIDSYDIPGKLIPFGVSYQWADKEFLPLCLEKGWTKVPFNRHANLFNSSCKQADGSIKVEHVWLVERPSEQAKIARLKEIEQAIENEVNAAEKITAAVQELNETQPDIKTTIKVSTHETGNKFGDTRSPGTGGGHNTQIGCQLDE